MGPSGHMWGVYWGKLNPTHEGHSQFKTQNDLPHEKDHTSNSVPRNQNWTYDADFV